MPLSSGRGSRSFSVMRGDRNRLTLSALRLALSGSYLVQDRPSGRHPEVSLARFLVRQRLETALAHDLVRGVYCGQIGSEGHSLRDVGVLARVLTRSLA